MFLLFLGLGVFGGFTAGLLGVGGAVIMIPLMLDIPPLFGFKELSMHTISGLSIIQVFFSSLSGIIQHSKNNLIHKRALIFIGTAMALGSIAGVIVANILSGYYLLVTFGVFAVIAVLMMLRKPPVAESMNSAETPINIPFALFIGSAIGLLSGLVGAGGGFILIPLMIYALKIPLRLAVGTSLGIVLIGSIFGAISKIIAGHIEWTLAAALVLGAVPFAQIGASVSKKIQAKTLRLLLIAMILFTCVQTWWKILAPS